VRPVNKQLVNLIGAAATMAILLLAVLVVALPLFSTANATMATAADVAVQNRTQESALEGLTAQASEISEIEREVAELRLEIPETEHLEDVIELAARASASRGGALTAVRPGESTPFTPRTAEVVAARTTSGGAVPAAPAPAPEPTGEPAEASPPPTADPLPAEADPTGPQQVEVTVEIKTPDVATATLILDDLRAGPRLAAVIQANVLTEEETVTLTVTLLAFYRP
jgi:TolA-binding protein